MRAVPSGPTSQSLACKCMDGPVVSAWCRSTTAPLVEPARVDVTVDALRVIVNGVVLSAVEHPRKWPTKRQLALLDHMLGCLGLQKPRAVLVTGDDEGRSRSPATLGA
jgi:hypothetical protein